MWLLKCNKVVRQHISKPATHYRVATNLTAFSERQFISNAAVR